jgi:hypothetical protein
MQSGAVPSDDNAIPSIVADLRSTRHDEASIVFIVSHCGAAWERETQVLEMPAF